MKTVVPHVGADKEIVARIFVLPIDDAGMARAVGKRAIASYLTVPVYAAFHEWLGRGDELDDLWRLWKEGDRKAAAESIPDHVVDELLVWGKPEAVPRAHPALHRQRRHDARARAVLRPGDQLRAVIRRARAAAASPSRRGASAARSLQLDVVVADLREAQRDERAHDAPTRVDLAALEREARRRRRRVVVVVQALATGDERERSARSSRSCR